MVSQALDDAEPLYPPSNGRTSSVSTANVGPTRPESVQAAGERTRYRNLVAVASCSSVEAEVAGSVRRSARWMDVHFEVPESRGNVGGAVGVGEIAACRCAGCMTQWVVSSPAEAYRRQTFHQP